MVTLTREDVERAYDELERRINKDIKDGNIPPDAQAIRNEYISRTQGMYGTIMAITTDYNWIDIVYWLDEIEKERYGERCAIM